jgi:hypothetical protein
MLNCRDPLFGGGSKPDTLAGAARLSDEPNTVFSFIKSKFPFGSSSSRGTVSLNSRDQFTSLDRAYGNNSGTEKVLVHKLSRSRHQDDIDLETGGGGGSHGIQFPRRGSADRESSAHSMTSFDGGDGRSLKLHLEEIPESPTNYKTSLLPPQQLSSTSPPTSIPMTTLSPTHGTFSSSELGAIGTNGRGTIIRTPPLAAAASTRSERPRSQDSFGAGDGSEFYPYVK